MFLYYLFLGIAPSVFLLWFFYKKDKWEPEPKKKVLKIFFWGVVAIIPAVFIEHFIFSLLELDRSLLLVSLPLAMFGCFVIISPIEEFLKYAAVKQFMYRDPEFNEPMDGVIYMVAAGLGFAALENIFAIFQTADAGDATLAGILRGLLSTPAHACFSAYVGVYLGRAKFAKTKWEERTLIVKGLVFAIILHGLYNVITLQLPVPYSLIALLFLAFLWLGLMKEIKKLLQKSPFSQATPDSGEQSSE